MSPIRIGCVKYLNTLPLIEGLAAWKDAELVAAAPSELIGLLQSGRVDVALASVIDAARNEANHGGTGTNGGVTLLPVGMIGSDGPTMTVRVFSRVPIEKVRRVAVDTESHTSVALLRVVVLKKFGVRVEVTPLGGMPKGIASDVEAVLLIGDKVVTAPPPAAEFPHELDLGEAWKELTGLPFVYAVWMCRAGEEESLPVVMACEVLERQRLHNGTRMDRLVSRRAGERGWTEDRAADYLGSRLKFEFGEREREAVELFLKLAGELERVEK